MKNEIIVKIGVDCGNSKVNVVSDNYYNMFNSMLVENVGNRIEDADDTILINNRHFTVGQGQLTAGTAIERSLDEYEVLVSYAIAQMLKEKAIDTEDSTIKVHLGIGLPAGDYSVLKDSYKQQFAGNGQKEYAIKLNNKKYNYTITEVRVLPQGTILANVNKEIFADVQNTGFIIDIGSVSIDIQELEEGGKIIKTHRASLEEGVLKMTDDIATILKEQHSLSIVNNKTVEQSIIKEKIMGKNGQWINFNEEENIQALYNKKIAEVYRKIALKFPNITTSEKTVFIGGGAIVFRDHLKDYFNNVKVIENAEKLNAIAYYKFIGGKNAKY